MCTLIDAYFITMAHLGARAFSQISGEVVQTTAWVLSKQHIEQYRPVFFRLIEGNEAEKQQALLKQENRFDNTQQDDFKKIPGSPIAYWVSDKFREVYDKSDLLIEYAHSLQGMITGDNNIFLRLWHELSTEALALNKQNISEVNINSQYWIPYNKGGDVRKWYGRT